MTDLEISAGLKLLGLTQEDFRAVVGGDEAALNDLKLRAKKSYHRVSLELHPDMNGGDPEKTEQFRILAAVMHEIEAMTVPSEKDETTVLRIKLKGGRNQKWTTGWRSHLL